MSDAFAGTLHLVVRVSPTHRWLVVCEHLVGAVVLALLAWHRPLLLGLLPLLAGSARLGLRRAALNTPTSLLRLRWPSEGEMRWQTADGTWHDGRLAHAFVAGTWLVILTLRDDAQRWRRTRCLLFGDALTRQSHRQLRARLTVMPPQQAPMDA
ncbi:protein YgfX [Salinisphaera aquimarina]|uniref:Protein YgfX n=1 Tax=Salinisphaera aquimarina TaxID=2094031 RepID=A0ABV7ESC1_9GAMM